MTIQTVHVDGGNDRDRFQSEREGACRFVESLVAAALSIDLRDMRAARRGRAGPAFARQTAMYLAHVKLGLRLSEVGRYFRRDRTTVAHACASIEDRRDDPACEAVIECLEAAVDAWLQGFSGTGGAR